MRALAYKDFSFATHCAAGVKGQPTFCQWELTFGCPLHCCHCYADCYNTPARKKRELGTKEVLLLADRLRKAGVLWLCLTGGDPVSRKDFPEIYRSIKRKGFIITVFTSGASLTNEALEAFKQSPPFAIEMTLNAATEKLYERIARAPGSFSRCVRAIAALQKAGLPLKVKTQVTRQNLHALEAIQRFLAARKLPFNPDYHLHARLDGDTAPCALRVTPQELARRAGIKSAGSGCERVLLPGKRHRKLFNCTVGSGDGFYLDPYGNMFLCTGLRAQAINILEAPVSGALRRLLLFVRQRRFLTGSRCSRCAVRDKCMYCPGRAALETGDLEAHSDYYCGLTRLLHTQ
jgi:MoaA/NifB/PqqE/SkfB family radical SAM enzyme